MKVNILILLLLIPTVVAISSNNYEVKNIIINPSGTQSSDNYKISFSNEPITATTSSTNYKAHIGFYYDREFGEGVEAVVIIPTETQAGGGGVSIPELPLISTICEKGFIGVNISGTLICMTEEELRFSQLKSAVSTIVIILLLIVGYHGYKIRAIKRRKKKHEKNYND